MDTAKNSTACWWLVGVCVALMVLRVVLGACMPLCIHAGALYDDAWAVDSAQAILSGGESWLGEYDDVTLIKNLGFPLYLAALGALHIPYTLGTSLLNALAAAFLALSLKPLFKRNGVWLVVFALLLFNPVGLACDTFQRVYRNSVTAAQAELIFGAYLGTYLQVKLHEGVRLRHIAPWMVVGAFGLSWFWISREDSIWVAPFVGVATVVVCVLVVRKRKATAAAIARGASAGVIVAALVLMVLPLGATAAASSWVKARNEADYGLATTAEINSGEFARFIKDLYAIAPDELPENLHVACPHTSVAAAYAQSPTLASIREQVEERFYNWGDKYDNDPGDGEVNGGEFFWVFRLAGAKAGIYTSAPEAEAFWGACADELEQAFESGALSQRSVMPSSIMTPWRGEYAALLPGAAISIYAQACSYADVTCMPWASQGSADEIAAFEQLCAGTGYTEGDATPFACTISEGLTQVYRVCGSVLGVAGLVAFVALLALWVRKRRVLQESGVPIGAAALVCTALFLGVFVLIAGLSYTRVSSFTPISFYYYGSAAYPLLLAFNTVAVCFVARCAGAVKALRGNDEH